MDLAQYKKRTIVGILDELELRYGNMYTPQRLQLARFLRRMFDLCATEQQVDEMAAEYARLSVQAYKLALVEVMREDVLGLIDAKDRHPVTRQYLDAPREARVGKITLYNLRQGPDYVSDEEIERKQAHVSLLSRNAAARYNERRAHNVVNWYGDPIHIPQQNNDDDDDYRRVDSDDDDVQVDLSSSSDIEWERILDTPPPQVDLTNSPPQRSNVSRYGRQRREPTKNNF